MSCLSRWSWALRNWSWNPRSNRQPKLDTGNLKTALAILNSRHSDHDLDRSVVTLYNRRNYAAEFSWSPILTERGTAFSIRPAGGIVEAFKDLKCEVCARCLSRKSTVCYRRYFFGIGRVSPELFCAFGREFSFGSARRQLASTGLQCEAGTDERAGAFSDPIYHHWSLKYFFQLWIHRSIIDLTPRLLSCPLSRVNGTITSKQRLKIH